MLNPDTRKRFNIFVRLNAEQKSYFEQKRKEYGFRSRPELFRAVLIENDPHRIARQEFLRELKKQGTNLNQIAKSMNTFGASQELVAAIKQLQETHNELLDVSSKF